MYTRTSWGAIFAGTFVFLAIEATFGLLAVAIFGTSAVPGIGAGKGIWAIVLSFIAVGIAARATVHLGGISNSWSAMYHGLATFGLCIFTSFLIAVGMSLAVPAAAMSAVNVIGANPTWLFFTLLAAGIAAIGGARPVAAAAEARMEERSAFRPAA